MKVKDGRIEDIDNFTGAIEWCDGSIHPSWPAIFWLRNGKHHNENGPAVALGYKNGSDYFLSGREIPKELWKIEVEKLKGTSYK
jgi:hypothetical protein